MFHHMGEMAAESGTQAIDRAAELLVSVVESSRPLGVGELATSSGLPKSTTSRLVGALERRGLVQRAGDRRVAPGPVLLRFAHQDRSLSLVELALPALRILAELSGETINLGVPTPLGVEHLAQEDSRHFMGGTNWVGRRVPYETTANGKVLKAFSSRTAEGKAIRERGYASAVDELEQGLAALAAPIFGPGRRRRRRALHLRPDDPPDPRAHRRARSATDHAGRSGLRAARTPRQARCRMTHEEILQGLYDETLVGNAPEVKDLVNKGLADGLGCESMLYDALIPSLEEVGARFERGDYFVPEMLIAARAMQGALDILRPLLAETGAKPIGTYVMGTVKGDVHDIGKNLVNIMLEGAGFTVYDLGVNVAPETFVQQIQEHKPDVVGFSAFLTTTMPMFKANINALQKAGIRDDVIVMVGGAPVTQEYADAVGADGYAADASTAVRLAKDLIEKRRSAVPA